jgi:IS5 family transposase
MATFPVLVAADRGHSGPSGCGYRLLAKARPPPKLKGRANDQQNLEDARDIARALAKTEAFEQSRRERKKVEVCFAHMKRIFKLDRLRLRGLSAAKDEVLLTATAQNLRRLVKFLCRPPPRASVTCAA